MIKILLKACHIWGNSLCSLCTGIFIPILLLNFIKQDFQIFVAFTGIQRVCFLIIVHSKNVELYAALKKIKNRKAAGLNEISPEVWKTRKCDDILL